MDVSHNKCLRVRGFGVFEVSHVFYCLVVVSKYLKYFILLSHVSHIYLIPCTVGMMSHLLSFSFCCCRIAGAAALMGKYPGGFGNMLVKAAKGKDVLAGQFWGVRCFCGYVLVIL